jgi:hypothetical protein
MASGSVTDDLQFCRFVPSRKQFFDAQHRWVLQLRITTLPALKDRQRLQDHDREIARLERQVGDTELKGSTTDSATHDLVLLTRRLSSHSSGSGRYIVTILTLLPFRSVAI